MATEPVPSAQSHSPALRRRRTNTGGATPPGPGARPALPQVHSLYQPVVHLQTRTVIGYEALARGPEGPRAPSFTPRTRCSPPPAPGARWVSWTGRAG